MSSSKHIGQQDVVVASVLASLIVETASLFLSMQQWSVYYVSDEGSTVIKRTFMPPLFLLRDVISVGRHSRKCHALRTTYSTVRAVLDIVRGNRTLFAENPLGGTSPENNVEVFSVEGKTTLSSFPP